MKEKVSISWSGGKDSAFALYKVMRDPKFEVAELHAIFNRVTKRVGMHGTSVDVIQRQAKAIGLPLKILWMEDTSHDGYVNCLNTYYRQLADNGITTVVFGDIFLEDLKNFRDDLLIKSGLKGLYPLWKLDSQLILNDFLEAGFKTILCAVHSEYFSKDHLGKFLSNELISSLASPVDVCGENGEFHTLVVDGPIFQLPLSVNTGSVAEERYQYQVIDSNGLAVQQSTTFYFQDIY